MPKSTTLCTTFLACASAVAIAQQPCSPNIRLEGIVTDATGAVIAGAHVASSDGRETTSDTSGHYAFPCPPSGTLDLHFTADGFTEGHLSVAVRDARSVHADIKLSVAAVQSEVQVSGDDPSETADRTTGTRTLSSDAVRQLADDPDEFNRQLQALAAAGGSMPGSALITVDGFQNASTLPPKSSIAFVRVGLLWCGNDHPYFRAVCGDVPDAPALKRPYERRLPV